ncbi:ParB/RepB/Spo0J family partition protein [Streptomyces sp. NPDC127038]|uniref:ParB/RepB/Spo0J family partition protein n=1 Tax=Streptomyces sp. NPDC127038 TaxID=3347114 RepID=UPI00365A0A01
MAGPMKRPARKSTKPVESKPSAREALYEDKVRSGDVLELPLTSLCPNPFNKRQMRGIPELAATIAEVGLLQNIAHIRAEVWLAQYPETREKITADNVILFGEHRWRAFQHLQRSVITTQLCDDKVKDARLITLIENLRRAQLSVLEEAEHYQALRNEGLSYEQIAEKVGETAEGSISKGTVWKRVKLLELDEVVLGELHAGNLAVSAAEKILTLPDPVDQRDALKLIQGGMHSVAAQSQILSRKRPAPEVREGAGEEQKTSEVTVSTGNDEDSKGGSANAQSVVSSGNGKAAPPRQRQKEEAKPAADQFEEDRAKSAASRDAAIQQLLEQVDLAAPETSEMLVQVLTAATLAPPQQGAAQQRALAWLRRAGRHELDETRASAYFNAVLDSGNENLRRLAAFACALAACELRTSARRQSWGSREIAHVKFLQQYALYIPETSWEQKELGQPVAAGANR